MIGKPQNHVTREMAARVAGGPSAKPWPEIPQDLIARLKEEYPPRCRALGEDELGHQNYAGAVQLIGHLETIAARQVAEALDYEQGVQAELTIADLQSAERASDQL